MFFFLLCVSAPTMVPGFPNVWGVGGGWHEGRKGTGREDGRGGGEVSIHCTQYAGNH